MWSTNKKGNNYANNIPSIIAKLKSIKQNINRKNKCRAVVTKVNGVFVPGVAEHICQAILGCAEIAKTIKFGKELGCKDENLYRLH